MAAFRFSRRAEADLLSIGVYTLRTWGEVQTARYMNELEACCQMLAGNPRIGRLCDYIRPGLRCMEHDKHVVFYREEPGGVLISRTASTQVARTTGHRRRRKRVVASLDLRLLQPVHPHSTIIFSSVPVS